MGRATVSGVGQHDPLGKPKWSQRPQPYGEAHNSPAAQGPTALHPSGELSYSPFSQAPAGPIAEPLSPSAQPPETLTEESESFGSGFSEAEPRDPELQDPEVSAVISRWRTKGVAPNAVAELERHPHWRGRKSVVVELAFEEFCLRKEAGENLDAGTFATRFPNYQQSVAKAIQTLQYLEEADVRQAAGAGAGWPQVGERINQFLLLENLGRGTFARVFLAADLDLAGRKRVLKISRPGDVEAYTLGKLDHPNVVQVLSLHTTDEFVVLCMLYRGRTTLEDLLDLAAAPNRLDVPAPKLWQHLQRRNSPGGDGPDSDLQTGFVPPGFRQRYFEAVLEIAFQCAQGLQYIHGQGVFHRDLKPSNILLDTEGRPVLLDFNLAVEARYASERCGGTLPYMAPEQLAYFCHSQGAPPTGSPQQDLYSFGVVLYELLTGKLPFQTPEKSESLAQVASSLLKLQQSGPPEIPRQRGLVDRELSKLVRQCLAVSPAGRPTSADQLAQQLEAALSRWGRLRRWTTRRRALISTAATGVALLAGGSSWLQMRRSQPEWQYQQGLAYFRQGRSQEAYQSFAAALSQSPSDPTLLLACECANLRCGFQASTEPEAQRQWSQALRGFNHLLERANLNSQQELSACLALAYAFGLLGQTATTNYSQPPLRELVHQNGFEHLIWANNSAFAHCQPSSTGQPQRAQEQQQLLSQTTQPRLEAALREARWLRAPSHLQAILHWNLADVHRRLSGAGGLGDPQEKVSSFQDLAQDHIEDALWHFDQAQELAQDLPGPCWDQCKLLAAMIHSHVSQTPKHHWDRAQLALQAAADRGLSPPTALRFTPITQELVVHLHKDIRKPPLISITKFPSVPSHPAQHWVLLRPTYQRLLDPSEFIPNFLPKTLPKS